MSQEEDESAGLVRSVTKPYRSRSDDEMNLMGMLLGLGLVMVMLPLLPFLALLWVASKLAGVGASPAQ